MNKLFNKHAFIIFAGITSLFHSIPAIAVAFDGVEPNPQFSLSWFGWIIPAIFFALTIDLGQVIAAFQISDGNRNKFNYIMFAALSILSFYLQMLYISSHTISISIQNVSGFPLLIANLFREFSPLILSLSIPMITILNTFSFSENDHNKEENKNDSQNKIRNIRSTIYSADDSISNSENKNNNSEIDSQYKNAVNRLKVNDVVEYLMENPEKNIDELIAELQISKNLASRALNKIRKENNS